MLESPASATAVLSLVPEQMPDVYAWRDDLTPIAALKKGRTAALHALAKQRGCSFQTVRRKYDLFVKHGLTGLVDRRSDPALWDSKEKSGLSFADEQLVKLWCESFQRKSEPALRAMLRTWRSGRLSSDLLQRGLTVPETDTPLDPTTGYPRGWSLRNLMRYAPSDYELAANRIGRTAAAAHRSLVYTTRRGLYVGQFYLFDDMWHDHTVNDLDQRKSGRPLEFHALDLASACKFGWGNRVRVELETKHEGLKSCDFRFLLAAILFSTGYNPRGTTLIVEHGTAAISSDLEALLHTATNGAITVERSGMQGAATHAGQYAGRAKGNFKFKAALESLGNLIHNEMAALPGQVGMNRDHAPEQMHDGGRFIDITTGQPLARFGALKHNDALLAALSQLPPERAQWLQWDFCSIQQFRLICEEVYGRINLRQDHELEGWDERYVPDPRTGRMRRLSPMEVFQPARRNLASISIETVALILGHENGTERMTRSGMIELRDGEISGDLLRYDAAGLPDREKFTTLVNPFDPSRLFVYGARGNFLAALPRLQSVSRADVQAVHEECGRAAKREAALLAPIRARHLKEAREKAARHKNNADVLSGAPITPEERAIAQDDARRDRSAARFGQALSSTLDSRPAPLDPAVPVEDWDAPTPAVTPQPHITETW